jgi:predicted RNA methylase
MVITTDTIEALKLIEVNGTAATITEKLDRSLYLKVDKALAALGGIWNRKNQCHEFTEDPSVTLADAITTGEIEVTKDPKQVFQFYETPVDLAESMVDSLHGYGLSMLEPSAASGRIARAAVNKGHEAAAVEIQPQFYDQLANTCEITIIGDFLECEPSIEPWGYFGDFDAIVMNPPFCRHQDIKHVLHAWKFLRPGGQLRAIVSPSFTFKFARSGAPKKFAEFLESIKAKHEPLPAGTFKASGTMVKTMLISATKG